MSNKAVNYLKIKTLAATIIALVAFHVPFSNILAASQPVFVSVVDSANDSIGIPVNIKIPKIAVDAVIEKVGLKTDGSMDVPKLTTNGGWYMLGSKPGEIGSAVIAGHLNWWNGQIGVFEHLKSLKPGDMVTVQDDKGALISFMVRESRSFSAGADATDVFNSNDGQSHLNLVTCDGAWVTSAKQYSNRLVVFTDRVFPLPITPTGTDAMALRARVQGRILLQVERNGEAWYVNPTNGLRYYMKDGPTAYAMMRAFGLGITDADLARLQAGDKALINRLRGRILLQVQKHGEAYYVHPDDGVARYMANGEAAYALMRSFSLGISDADLLAIPVGEIK